MSPNSTRVPSVDLGGVDSAKGLSEMVLEFFIWEVSCLKTTPDQVTTRLGLGGKDIKKCSKSSAGSITNDRVADLPTDHERHVH
jgi:hypothetical protein